MVFKSVRPKLDIPNVDIWSLLFEAKDRPASEPKDIFIDPVTGRGWNYDQLRETSTTFGKALKSQWGWKKGDVLGFFAPNNIDYPAALWGVLWAGGICTTANPTYTLKELTFQMKDAGAKAIITILPVLPMVLEAAKVLGIPEDRIILLGDDRDKTGKIKHFTELRDTSLLLSPSRTKSDPTKDIAFLVYSSGTTGLPKGVMLTHSNIIANVLQASYIDSLNGLDSVGGNDGLGDKQLGILPFFHIYGLTVEIHVTMYKNLQCYVMPKFNLEEACKHVQDHKITFMFLAPPIILGLAKHPLVSKYDLSSVKWINSGAAPLTSDIVDAFWNRLAIPVKQGYGLSETSPTSHVQTIDEWAKFKGSVGKLVSHMEAKIVDDSGKELATGETGELWIRGPNVFPGYYNRPELADKTFSKCGFFMTGDVGYVDNHGNFYITDRVKELIKYKGFQVAPAELEGLLIGHDEIVDACVVPVYDKQRASEVPLACIVLRPNVQRSDEKAKEIIDWVASKVAQHKQLRGGVKFIDEVPKNASGKLLRRVLREQVKKEGLAIGAKL